VDSSDALKAAVILPDKLCAPSNDRLSQYWHGASTKPGRFRYESHCEEPFHDATRVVSGQALKRVGLIVDHQVNACSARIC
jgi:hypothetical protein